MLSRPYYNEIDIRKRQIDTLKIFNDNVIEIKENSEYRVEFTSSGFNMSLDVVLSPDFPNEKPVILVNPVINHPWIADNSNLVIGAPGLLNFTIHSDLGRVVQAIIREFSKFESTDRAVLSPLSFVSAVFPELNDLSVDDLSELMQNTDLQDRLLESHPQLLELERATEETMLNIENIARDNLTKQQFLENVKTEIIDTISTIVQLKSDFEELNKKHQKLSEAYDPCKIRDGLHDAALSAELEADSIAEKFLAGDIAVDAFVTQYVEKRTLGQSRRTRGERLAHQLEQLNRATF